jgi:hypothetical protein
MHWNSAELFPLTLYKQDNGILEGHNMLKKLLIMWMMTILLTGCQTLSERRQSEALREVLGSYQAMIRWGSVEQAKAFQDSKQTQGVTASIPKDLRVTQYEVVQGPAMVGPDRAVQTAIIQYVFEESQVVRELMDRQTWEYDADSERWFLVSPMPVFK